MSFGDGGYGGDSGFDGGYGQDQDDDLDGYGYSTSYPNPYGGHHRTEFDRHYGDHYSEDTDRDGRVVPETGHYTPPREDRR